MTSRHSESNKKLWDRMVPLHLESPFYDVPRALAGQNRLTEIESDVLGDVRGKSVLHLQCHFGLDSFAIGRLGATVVGVDFSPVAIAAARSLNRKLKLDVDFVEAEVGKIGGVLKRKFDIVFASFGIFGWHQDIVGWFKAASSCLKASGRLCVADFHPVMWMFDQNSKRLKYSYFRKAVIKDSKARSYVQSGGNTLGTSYCWNHNLSQIFSAMREGGILLDSFKEFDYSPFRNFKSPVKSRYGYQISGLPGIPIAYSLRGLKSLR